MHSDYLISDKLLLQYDVPALKTLALNHIRGGLATCDIVEEAFSRFASRWVVDVVRVRYMLTEMQVRRDEEFICQPTRDGLD